MEIMRFLLTRKRLLSTKITICIILSFSLLYSCKTLPLYPPGTSSSFYFKDAKMAEFQMQYEKALAIYRLIQFRFAQDYYTLLEAEYSIAQLYYQRDDYENAIAHFQHVVEFYERPEIGSEIFTRSFLYLAKQNLNSLRTDS